MDGLPARPEFHFTPNQGWINDPYCLTFHNGQYHLFFQYVPDSLVWAPNCHWGHATSPDLVSWIEHPLVLAPGDGDDGVWSGSMAIDDGQATIFYTSVQLTNLNNGRVRTATPTDDTWEHWTKGDIVVTAPAELDLVAFRDPFVFRDGDQWRMLVGTGLTGTDVTGPVAAASSFSSTDLRQWSFDGLAAQRPGSLREPTWTGSLWECPQIFQIEDRHVLITSVWEDDVLHYVAYGIGHYADGRFEADSWNRLTYGTSYYAPSFFRDRDGNPGLIFWMRGVLDAENGRASALSVPHLLTLDGDQLRSQPHPDLRRHAGPPGASNSRETLPTSQAHLIDWTPQTGAHLALTRDGSTVLGLHQRADELVITTPAQTLALPGHGPITILLDGPATEVFTQAGPYAIGTTSDPATTLTLTGDPTISTVTVITLQRDRPDPDHRPA
jgi:beta-fructofuranosidase